VHPDQSRPIPDVTSAVEQLKIPYDNTPLPGDVAWFDINTFDVNNVRISGGSGHVAWVQSVNANNPSAMVALEDYNAVNTGLYHQRTLSASDVANPKVKFIHFSDWFTGKLQSTPIPNRTNRPL
jgi:surface antigen